jgi:hypothetical protein
MYIPEPPQAEVKKAQPAAQPEQQSMKELALLFANMGWPVFRLQPGDKKPLRGSHGFLDATTDTKQIQAWWDEEPAANVGIATGAASGLLVIDVDVKNPSIDWRRSLHELDLPVTYTVRTPSGGQHLYFSLPEFRDGATPNIGSSVQVLPGIDIRCNGGYVVAPGCVVGGRRYDTALNEPIEVAPPHIVSRFTSATKQGIERDDGGHMVIRNGGRDQGLMLIATAIRNRGVGLKAIYRCLQAVNYYHCETPMEDWELRKIARSVARYEAHEPTGEMTDEGGRG